MIAKPKVFFCFRMEQNFIEAAAAGASQSISLVANIAANLIAFLSLLAFVNAMLSWFGSMVDCPQLSFEVSVINKMFIELITYICTQRSFSNMSSIHQTCVLFHFNAWYTTLRNIQIVTDICF